MNARRHRFAPAAAIFLGGASLLVAAAAASDAPPQGDWRVTLDDRGTVHTGILTLESDDGELAAFVDGGPATVTVDDKQIEFTFDTRDGGGRLLEYVLRGQWSDDAMGGTLIPPLDAPEGSWHAEPYATPAAAPPQPVDFSGVWSRMSSGTARVTLDYTPSAQAVVDNYSYLDDPALRCVSPGLVRVSGWPYPLEIVQEESKITILYESFHEVRRIFLDGRDYPADSPHRFMGYSIGRWEGSTLVVDTQMLLPGFVDLAGQPLSENARVVERMSLSDDGQILRAEMTVYDPENYRRPITRHRSWRKSPETEILEYDCDPYPFFRGLELEGRLEEYWQRMRQRR